MKVRFFDPGRAFKKIEPEIMLEINRILENGDLILRKDVEDFEKKLAEFVGTEYAVALNSGTDALYLALKAAGVIAGDRVAVPSYTFVATAQVVNQIGATPVLYDLDGKPSNYVKLTMVTHMAGELSPIPEGVVIEDACQALGAVKNPKTLAQCWSFYPAKILGAYGDAGALTTNDEQVYNYVKEARNHFKTNYNDWGINSRMDNLQAAILNVKFKYLEETLQKRAQVAARYQSALKDLPLTRPNDVKGRVWQDYIIRCKDKIERDSLYDNLKAAGIETMKNEYPFPIKKGPKCLAYEAETLRLPCNENLTTTEVEYVFNAVRKFYGK